MRYLSRTENPDLASIADEFNRELNNLSTKSFGGEVVDGLQLVAGENVEIPHSLKVTPKYRVILRSTSQAKISDGTIPWDERKIYLMSDVDTVISLLILRS